MEDITLIVKQHGEPKKLILIKEKQVHDLSQIIKFYGDDFIIAGLPEKTSASIRKSIISDIKELVPDTVKCILCADTDMFKTLCRVTKVSGYDGYPTASELNIDTFIVPNYFSLFYNPEQKSRLEFIMDKVNSYLAGNKIEIGVGVVQSHLFARTANEIADLICILKDKEALTVDIETAVKPECIDINRGALRHPFNYIISIGFAWDKHNGGVIYVNGDTSILGLLKYFFNSYKGKMIFHNAGFDITNLIYHCYMSSLTDYEGMLEGLHILCRDFEDTKHIAYLCLNSCGNVDLGLKALSHEYCGNYAQDDIADCSKIPADQLMMYNLTDCCATWYVYDKYKPMLKTENQEEIYYNLFLSSQKVLIETQLVGLRINPEELYKLKAKLYSDRDNILAKINSYSEIQLFNYKLEQEILMKYNSEHKKQATLEDLKKLKTYEGKFEFNPNSTEHLSLLLYRDLKLPVVDTTKKGNPATGAETIKKLINHCDDKTKELLQAFIDYGAVDIIICTFLPSFEQAPLLEDGTKGLYGSFNLGGTVSGRLSSNSPNLQQLPSTGSPYAKPVKKIFINPTSYIFTGADQRSLEDRISALTTRDPNKLSVYTEGYDGHCLRSYYYYGDQMPDIKMASPQDRCFKVTLDNGDIEYLTENQAKEKGYI